MKSIFTVLTLVFFTQWNIAQTPILELESTTQGILIPTMTEVQRDAILSPAPYLIIFQSDGLTGLKYYHSGQWKNLNSGMTLKDNDGDTEVTVEYVNDEDKVRIILDGNETYRFDKQGILFQNGANNVGIGKSPLTIATGGNNVGIGYHPLELNTTGYSNIGIGYEALHDNTSGLRNLAISTYALHKNDSGSYNVALGYESLKANISGDHNVASGFRSLFRNTTGDFNVAVGYGPLRNNLTGVRNIAMGWLASYLNSSSNNNIAIGAGALYSTTSRDFLIAIGDSALFYNQSGGFGFAKENVAVGSKALMSNIDGNNNTALGYHALKDSEDGDNNTAIGNNTLTDNESGSGNTAVGNNAITNNSTGINNTALGFQAMQYNSDGDENTAIGAFSGVGFSYKNTTSVGYLANATADNQVRLGNNSVTSIGGAVNWSVLSDKRFKKNINSDVAGLKFINRLKPITYEVNHNALIKWEIKNNKELASHNIELPENSIRYTGFLAQDVAQIADEMDFDFSGVEYPQHEGDHYSLRYAEFVVPLVKSVQELSDQNEVLRKQLHEQQKLIDEILNELVDVKKLTNEVQANR